MSLFNIEPLFHKKLKLIRNIPSEHTIHVILDFQNIDDSPYEFIRLELYPEKLQGCAVEIRHGKDGCIRFLPEYDFLKETHRQQTIFQYIIDECNDNSIWISDEEYQVKEYGFTGYKRTLNTMPRIDESMIPIFMDTISKYNDCILKYYTDTTSSKRRKLH